jgi:uncharacterized protein
MSRGVALVTGASAGIGQVFAERLAARGYDLLLVARDGVRLDALGRDLAARHGVVAEVLPADLASDAGMDLVVERIAATPRLALLVNNAGFGTVGTLATADPVRQAEMVRLHALAPTRLTQAALRVLVPGRRGGVINVASVAGFLYSPGNVNYCATKAYLITMSEGLAAELRSAGVRAQALCPGFTHTEFHGRMQVGMEHIPRWMWLDAHDVVETSLTQLERGGAVVCIPGLQYKLLMALVRLLPRRALSFMSARRMGR